MNKKFALVLIAVLSVFADSLFAGEVEGFRGIKWGDDPDTVPYLRYYGEDKARGGMRLYTRSTDEMKIGAADLTSILYVFWQERFFEVVVSVSGLSNFKALKEATFERYGAVEKDNPITEYYCWPNLTGALMALKYDEITEKGMLLIYSNAISKEVKEYEKEKAREGAKNDF